MSRPPTVSGALRASIFPFIRDDDRLGRTRSLARCFPFFGTYSPLRQHPLHESPIKVSAMRVRHDQTATLFLEVRAG